jgi:peptidase E
MMNVWCRLGVDKLIKSAYENGTVLSGISAASICWFDSGHSDSMPFYKRRINYALQAMGKEEFIKVVTAEAHSGRSPCSRDEPADARRRAGIASRGCADP